MAEIRDWQRHREMSVRMLEKRTGEGLDAWNGRIAKRRPKDKAVLRAWLAEQGIDGYAQDLLVMERFGYPEWMTASAAELVDAQYNDRPELRPVYEKIIKAAGRVGEVAVQTRKTYVSLVSPRRTFARVQPSAKAVNLALRLEGRKPGGRLQPSKIHESMPLQVRLESPNDVDADVIALLREAYEQNA